MPRLEWIVPTGRRLDDPKLLLSTFTGGGLITGLGPDDMFPTKMLTLQQMRYMRMCLDEMIERVEGEAGKELMPELAYRWDGEERRHTLERVESERADVERAEAERAEAAGD